MMKFLLGFIFLFPTTLWASATFETKTDGDDNVQTWIVQNGRVLLEAGENSNLLFDSSNKKIWAIDHQNKRYFELSPEALKKQQAMVSQKMNEAMADIDSKLAGLPKEQRDKIKQSIMAMQQQKNTESKNNGPSYIKTKKTKKIGGVPCIVYNVTAEAKTIRSLCIADAKSYNFSKADQKTLKIFFTTMKDLAKELGNLTGAAMPEWGLESGFPVETIDHEKKARTVLTLKSQKKVSPKKFQLPPKYQATDLSKMIPGQ